MIGQRVTTWQSHSGAVNVSTTPKIENGYAAGSANTVRPETFTYPDGRVISYDYGEPGSVSSRVSRIASIIDDDDTHLADYEHLGLGAVVKQHSPEPDLLMTLVSLDHSNDPDTGDIYAGVDRFGRVKDLRWRNVGEDADLSRVQYGYNRASNRVWRGNPTDPDRHYDWLYTYDGLQRLVDAQRGTLVFSGSQPSTLDPQLFRQCWTLDPTGNWRGFRQDDDGASAWDLVQARTADEANQITGITNSVGSAWAQPAYDLAGNMTAIPKPAEPTEAFDAVYDAWNRLVELTGVATYRYDAGGFRLTTNDGVDLRHFYYTNAWQAIEERLGSSADPDRQFVWGLRYIDDLVLRDRTTEATLDERLYALQDGNWNVTAVVDDAGEVQERYEYEAYGETVFLDSTSTPVSSSASGWETTYGGYRIDAATGCYAVRFRDLHPLFGWLEADPLGYVDSANLRGYLTSSPLTSVDPSGLGKRTDMINEINASMGIPRPVNTDADRRFDQGMAVLAAPPAFVSSLPASAVQGTLNIAQAGANQGLDALYHQLIPDPLEPFVPALQSHGIIPRPPHTTFALNAVLPEDPAWQQWGGVIGLFGVTTLAGLSIAPVPAARPCSGRLVHLTNAEAGANINTTGTLIGNIYAGPISNAEATGISVTLQTGLSPSAFEVAVPIPSAASTAFTPVRPIGPLTLWQWSTGQQYTANGVLNLATGEFVRHGVNWNQATIYLIDVGFTGTIVAWGAIRSQK